MLSPSLFLLIFIFYLKKINNFYKISINVYNLMGKNIRDINSKLFTMRLYNVS